MFQAVDVPAPSPADIVASLGRSEVFAGLDEHSLATLAAACRRRAFERGALVFVRGDSGDGLYQVFRGRIKISVESSEGGEMLLTTLRPPETFGELALIDARPRSATAEAMEASELLWIGRDAFQDAYRRHPQILENLLLILGQLVRRLTDQAADLALLDLEGRVARVLVRLQEREGTDGDTARLDLGLTQSELASMVGASRQSVNEILHGLERAGYLQVHGRQLTIRRPRDLRLRAGL